MELHQAAMQFIGIPWRHRGRTDYGLDCIGLVVRSIEACGGQVADRRDYGREPWNDGLRHELKTQLFHVEREPQVNDILLMKYRRNGQPAHVAIICPHPQGGLGIIHAYGEAKDKRVTLQRYGERQRALTAGVFEWVAD